MVVFGLFAAPSSAALKAELRARRAARSSRCTGQNTPAVLPEHPIVTKPSVVEPAACEEFLIDCSDLLKRKGTSALAGRYTASIRMESELAVEKKVLGCGKSGSVKVGRWHQSSARCAVKSLSKKHLDKLGRMDLKSEVETYLSVDHPNIATLERVYETAADVHVVMECLEGGEVFDRVAAKRKFSEAEASEAVRQMLLALAYLHTHEIVHRDIKLENFVYEAEDSDHLKLIDFGYARRFSAGSPKMRHANGTVHYMAPEVLQRCYTEKADLWSMGIVAYMLLCGSAPWSLCEAETMRMIAAGQPRFWPSVFDPLGADAKAFVRSLLVSDPEQRLSAVQALEHPWLRRSSPAAAPNAVVMRSLRDYGQTSQLRRSCIALSIWSLSGKSQASARQCFFALANPSGSITAESLREALEASKTCEAEATGLFHVLDRNGDGEISWCEFLAAFAGGPEVLGAESDALSRAFGRFDKEMLCAIGSGDSKKAGLDDLCAFMRMPFAHHWSLEAVPVVPESGESSLSSRVQSFSSSVSVGSVEQNLCENMSSNCCLQRVAPKTAKGDEAMKQSAVCLNV